jgi:hypothetical protein
MMTNPDELKDVDTTPGGDGEDTPIAPPPDSTPGPGSEEGEPQA